MQMAFGVRSRALAASVALQTALIVFLTWNSVSLIQAHLRSELRAHAAQIAPLFNAALGAPMLQRDYASVQAIVQESLEKKDILYIIVCDSAGRMVAQGGWPEGQAKPDVSRAQPVALEGGGLRFDFKAPIMLAGQGLGELQYGLSGAFIEQAGHDLVGRMIWAGLAAMILFSLLIALAVQLLTRRLTQLAQASQQMHLGDYEIALPEPGSDEIGALTRDFAHMAAEVKRKVGALTASEELLRGSLADLAQKNTDLDATRVSAEAANQAKSDFLAKMSHEIRTPMHGILGMLDLLQSSPLDAQQRERFEVVQRSGEALLEVVNDVLDFSKMQAGKLELQDLAYSPADIARDCAHLFAPRAEGKGVTIALEIEENLAPLVHGDPARLRQVLGNLVSNAVKFTERGAVTLRLQSDGPGRLSLEVQDSGIGIEPEATLRIFEPFAQADDSTSRRFGGTGLGLAICREIVKLMGGDLSVSSKPGVGSSFRARWPAAAAVDRRDAASAPRLARTETPSFIARVLLAEDNPVNQLLAETMLAKLGCQTRVAANGQAAVELFAQGGFDIVLMDCHMPEMDGYQAAAAIRALEAQNGAPRLPIVALTASVMADERQRCLDAGMDDYLSKPFRLSDLAGVLGRWAGQTRR